MRMFPDVVGCAHTPHWKIFSENFVPDNVIDGDLIFNVKDFKEKITEHLLY